MRYVDGRAPRPSLVRDVRRRFDWDAELSTAATLDRHQRRLSALIADAGQWGPDQRAAGERIRMLTRLLHGLSRAAVTESLTGLRNRQGFVRDGCLLLTLAVVCDRCAIVFFFDVDRLKEANNDAGHSTGDDMPRCAAPALIATFRNSDIIGRLGGAGFVAITLTRRDDAAPTFLDRLARAVNGVNASRKRWPLELSAGVAIADPTSSSSLGPLVDCPDRSMYHDKRTRSTAHFRWVYGQTPGAQACRGHPRPHHMRSDVMIGPDRKPAPVLVPFCVVHCGAYGFSWIAPFGCRQRSSHAVGLRATTGRCLRRTVSRPIHAGRQTPAAGSTKSAREASLADCPVRPATQRGSTPYDATIAPVAFCSVAGSAPRPPLGSGVGVWAASH